MLSPSSSISIMNSLVSPVWSCHRVLRCIEQTQILGKGSRKGTVRQHPSSTPVMSPVPVPAENDKTKYVAQSNSDWDRGQHELQKMACLIHVFVGGT